MHPGPDPVDPEQTVQRLALLYAMEDEAMPLVVRGAVQRGAVSSLAVLLFDKPDAELAAAAGRAWARLFGAPLPAVTMTKKSQEKRWRH